MTKTIFIALLLLTGCATNEIDKIRSTLICQDYANAWAREAVENGLLAGVIWFESDVQKAHAICWANDPVTDETVYIEPWGSPRRIKNPEDQPGYKLIKCTLGPTL